MDKTSIADRMKNNYEKRSRGTLTRRTPVIIRLDGKAFHTFTKGFNRPFSEDLNRMMCTTTKKLCEEIQGAKLGYTQSDEISILVTDYDTFTTDAWFDYQIQKICSVSASIATAEFNREYLNCALEASAVDFQTQPYEESFKEVIELFTNKKTAYFDSRCFNIPKEEVVNYFIWRQQDWVRNSIQMLSQSLFSHKELHCKNTGDMKEMCYQKGHNWSDLPWKWRNGNICSKTDRGWEFSENPEDFKDLKNWIETDLLTAKED